MMKGVLYLIMTGLLVATGYTVNEQIDLSLLSDSWKQESTVSASKQSSETVWEQDDNVWNEYQMAMEKTNSLSQTKYSYELLTQDMDISGTIAIKSNPKAPNQPLFLTEQQILNDDVLSQYQRMWGDGESVYLQTRTDVVKSSYGNESEWEPSSLMSDVFTEDFMKENMYKRTSDNGDSVIGVKIETNQLQDLVMPYLFDESILTTIFEEDSSSIVNFSTVYEYYINKEGYIYKFSLSVENEEFSFSYTCNLLNYGEDFNIDFPIVEENETIDEEILTNNELNVDFLNPESIKEKMQEFNDFIGGLKVE